MRSNFVRTRRHQEKRHLSNRTRLLMECLEDRTLLSNGLWVAYFGGMAGANSIQDQTSLGAGLLQSYGISEQNVRVVDALDLSGAFVVQTATDVTREALSTQLNTVPNFIHTEEFEFPEPKTFRETTPARDRSEGVFGPFDYDSFLSREKNGEFPNQGGPVDSQPADSLTNNNAGATGTSLFTQSETDLLAFGNNVVVAYNDSGSNAGGTNRFTGFSYSSDGGVTFTDGGSLPTSTGGDAGDPVLARNETTGRIYFATLGFSVSTIQVFRSDDNGVSWMSPVNGTPGGSSEDKEWMAVDNNAGAGNGNVYILSRRFGTGPGIYFFRSTDDGATFGPTGGTLIVTGSQGAFVAVGPDHSIYAFWYAGTSLQMRKSTDFGTSFGAPVTVVTGLVGGTNGDLALTGLRQGTATFSGFRSNEFPHVAVNPVSGHIYTTFADNPAGTDKANVYMVMSTDGGLTWGPRVLVNDDVTTTDQWQPTIAVTPGGDRVGVFYYSRQEDPTSNNLFKYYGRIGTISGSTVTFLPSFAVSDTASLPEFGRDSLINSVYMGDYDHAVATPGAFHVTWSDSRDDLAGGAPRKDPNVYYKKIPLGLAVTTTVPAVGSVIATQPTTFTVNVTEPIDDTTLGASDFQVNGTPADGYSYTIGSTTIEFTFTSSPVTSQGLQVMHIDAGAFTRAADGNPVIEFTGPFRYDTLLLQVDSTSPPFPGGVFTLPGPFTYDVTFNELINPASVQVSDLTLSGIAGALVTGATVLPGDTTVRFTISGVTVEGTLTATIPGTAITDAYGNAGTTFSASYAVDIGTVPYPVPLTPKNPRGSLIYDPSIAGIIGFAGDTDSFFIPTDPDVTVTVIVKPAAGLQPSVTLLDPTNTPVGSNTAGAAGQNALIQTAPAPAGGTYTIVVSGAGGTTGSYTVQLILNAAQEEEGTLTGASNNTLGAAQNIDGSFLTVSTSQASAQRGAALGTVDSTAGYAAAAVPFTFTDISATGTDIPSLTGVDDSFASASIGFSFTFYGTAFTSLFVSSNGLMSFVSGTSSFSNLTLSANPAQATIAPFWDDLHITNSAGTARVKTQVIGPVGSRQFIVQWDKVRFFSGGSTADPITFQAVLNEGTNTVQFNYLDVVSATAAGNNGGSASVGVKRANPTSGQFLELALNNGPNAFVGTGQSTLVFPVLPNPDNYAFTLAAGETATLAVTGQTPGTVTVELLDGAGSVLATGVAGSTNLTRVISNYSVSSTATYYARVLGDGLLPYSLVVTRDAALDTEANDAFGSAQAIGGNHGALGAITSVSNYVAAAVPFTFTDISVTGTDIPALTGVDDVSTSVSIGFTYTFFGTAFTSLFVSSNGLITFGTANSGFSNATLSANPTQAAIAPLWDDLHITNSTGTARVKTQVVGPVGSRQLIIQWDKISFFSSTSAADTLTFQAVLSEGTNAVQFNYLDLVSGTQAGNNGASASAGLKAANPTSGSFVELAFNNGPNAFVGTGKSTLLTLPAGEDWYTIDVTNTGNAIRLDTSTPFDGPGEPVNVLDPDIELYDPSNTLVASGVTGGDGRNEFIAYHPVTTGSFRVRVRGDADSKGEYFVSRTTESSLVVLNPSAAGALSLSGNGTISVAGPVYVDSSSSRGLSASGNAQLAAAHVYADGGAEIVGNATVTPAPVDGFLSDPLAGLVAPTPGPVEPEIRLSGGSLTIAPGTYAGITLTGDASLTMMPGLYFIAGGGILVSGSASISGSEVTIYNASTASGTSRSSINIGGQGVIALSPPSSGDFAGVTIFHERTNYAPITLEGNAVAGVDGAIYAKSARVSVSGNGALNASIIADAVRIVGNGGSSLITGESGGNGSVEALVSAGQLISGIIWVSVQNNSGSFSIDQLGRISEAIATLNSSLGSFGINLVQVGTGNADLRIHLANASPVGGAAQGVLGFATFSGEIIIISGWNWYAGADSTAAGSDQYDFQTVITHELGHGLGLGHSGDGASVMFNSLSSATARRSLTAADLTFIQEHSGAGEGLFAAGFSQNGAVNQQTEVAPMIAEFVQRSALAALPTYSAIASAVQRYVASAVPMVSAVPVGAAVSTSFSPVATHNTGTVLSSVYESSSDGSDYEGVLDVNGMVTDQTQSPLVPYLSEPREEIEAPTMWSQASDAYFADLARSISDDGGELAVVEESSSFELSSAAAMAIALMGPWVLQREQKSSIGAPRLSKKSRFER